MNRMNLEKELAEVLIILRRVGEDGSMAVWRH